MRTIFWEDNTLKMIDQRRLPDSLEVLSLRTCHEVSKAIKNMTVRGAPAIGVAAAFGLALAAFESCAQSPKALFDDIETAAKILKATRPTAVNLSWALERDLRTVRNGLEVKNLEELRILVLEEAQRIADEDVEINRRMEKHGVALIEDGIQSSITAIPVLWQWWTGERRWA
jgi:methylthioribose-1-phosphate isomerase